MRCLTIGLVLFLAPLAQSAPTYWQDVRPLLRKHCTVCHSAKHIDEVDVSAGLALDTPMAIAKGSKLPVVAKQGAQSLLVTILRDKNPRRQMPLDADPLSDADVQILRDWIDAGMPLGTEPLSVSDPIVRAAITRRGTVVYPTKIVLPKTLAVAGVRSPVDLTLPIGPLSPISGLAYSPDGSLLAVGTYGSVTIWNLATGQPVKMLTNVLGSVNDIRFRPDGKWLAVSGGQPAARGDIRIYQVSDWKLLATLGGYTDVVASMAFSPDGTQLVGTSFDKTVRLWDMATFQSVGTFTGHSDFVYSVAFDPKGEWFVTASKDRTCRIIDRKTLKSRLTLSGMDQEVLAVAVSPDGKSIVSSGLEPQMHWWDAQTGERTKKVAGHDVAVYELSFAGDGNLVASAAADKTVRLWNPATGAQIRSLLALSQAYTVSLRPDGKQIAAGGFDGQVRIWEPMAGRQLVQLTSAPGPNSTINWLASTPEGFINGSGTWLKAAQWRLAEKPWKGSSLSPAATQPDAIRQAFRGEKLGEPGF